MINVLINQRKIKMIYCCNYFKFAKMKTIILFVVNESIKYINTKL